jgi:glycosyltransferase involved in cell wall biosynthesis
MTPRASFVIPAYNAERWISKTILSCRNQTIKQIEIIVVNDGSTDGTQEIVNWHAKEDDRVIPFDLVQNVGRSEARNVGNDNARAPIILVLDADDMAAKNRVRDTLAAFELKKADFVYGSFFVVDGFGNVQQKITCTPFDPIISKEKKLNFICHSTVAYTKLLSKDVRYDGGAFSNLGLDDWKFQWDVFRRGYAIKNIRTPLSYYRVSNDTISTTRNEQEVSKVKESYLAQV